MTMAGGYQTTGERANAPGYGGWITGRGDDTMIMFEGYRHLADFFTALPWWRLDPDDDFFEAQNSGQSTALVVGLRSDRNDMAVLYFPVGGSARVKPGLLSESLKAQWFNPRTGQKVPPSPRPPSEFIAPDEQDWVLLLY
jgi:hypothetical protein